MAVRPVFIVGTERHPLVRVYTEFQYYGGFSDAQKKRCIQSLHETFLSEYVGWRILEISSHSPEELGVALSAFHLPIRRQDGTEVTVECAYQAGKVFEQGGPYLDLLEVSSRQAKKDPRLRESGPITAFEWDGMRFPPNPPTLFYNWLYLSALGQHPELADGLMAYNAFTDIVFNPKRSASCQAQAAAIYVTLRKAGLLEQAMEDVDSFIKTIYHMNPVELNMVNTPEPVPAAEDPEAVTENPEQVLFQIQDQIDHPGYGRGTISDIQQHGTTTLLTIRFTCGEKRLAEKWVREHCSPVQPE